jgi:alcohol dehydrogenase (cytochrome c)
MDLKTNRLVWRQQWRDDCWSGSLATAGGLVFVGRSDGRLTALDSRNGERLWQFQTDSGVNAPASTFEYEGQQYVVVLSGGTLFAAGAKKGDSVWLFSTNGTLESFPISVGRPNALLYGAGHEPQVTFASGDPDVPNGKKIFHTFCTACHGDNGTGSHGGANLENASKDAKFVITMATTGRGDMPSFKGVLTPEQVRDVAGYITTDLFPSH